MNARQIFADALKIADLAKREAYIAKACKDNLMLRKEVDALLKASAKDLGFLDPSEEIAQATVTHVGAPTFTPPAASRPAQAEQAGEVLLGKYRLIEPIGEGGMGAVWYAEQKEPVVRKVAIKLIKPGMASKGVLARFDAERQALAVMDHPNIARVYDGGVAPDGRPFFVMELVKGVPITKFCDQRRLTTRERLELFIPICRAIQHAHQKGIIHRDIKPSNVLVCLYDDVPVPKVIDFGVAKATGQKLTEMTLDTGFGAVVGTPTYMSPEQASLNQLDIDTRSDVYSLGVLLYELLVGSPPFPSKRLQKAGLMEMLRVIREEDPPKPSTKLSTDESSPSISANRRTEPRTLSGILRNELDWVVMKALEKDRARRYETADGLALDVQRYLAGEAVAAVPPSMAYRLKKFLRKHRGPVVAVSMLVLVLLLGIAGTTFGMIEANVAWTGEADQRKKVEDQRDTVIKAHKRADDALFASRKMSATLALDNGLAMCAKGDVAPGMLWFARALDIVPPEATELERVIRINLGDWRQELHPLQFVLSHPDTVYTMDAAPDGKSVVTGCLDKKARVWDLTTGRLRFAPLEHQASLVQVKYSPDGRRIATSDYAGNVRLWDAATGKAASPNITVNEMAEGIAFSPNSEVLAAIDIGRALQFWKASNGEAIGKPIHLPGRRATNIAYRPDGKFLVVANQTTSARIVDLEKQAVSGELSHAKGVVENVAFSSDGKYCVTVGKEPSGQLWDAATFKALPATFTHQDMVYRALFSPDGKRLVTGSTDQTARLWNAETAQPIGLPMPNDGGLGWFAFSRDSSKLLTGSSATQLWDAATAKPIGGRLHQDSVCTGVALTPDARLMVSAGWDGRVKVWQNPAAPRPGHVLPNIEGAITSLAFSSDGKYVGACELGGYVHLWDVATGKRIADRQGEGHMVRYVTFSSDDKLFASGSDNDRASLWDTRTFTRIGEPIKCNGAVSKVSFSVQDDRLFTAVEGKDRAVQVWDLKTRKRVGPEYPIRDEFSDFAVSPSGKVLLIGDAHGARLFDIDSGKVIADLPHENAVLTVAFNRDNLALTGSTDKTAAIWDASGKRLQRVFHQSSIQTGAFSHQGRLVATAGTDRTAHIWRVEDGQSMLRLLHPGSINSLAWSIDDRTLLTGCEDGQARLWDVATGRLLGRPQFHPGDSRKVAISSAGQLASGGRDGTVRLWPMPTPWTESPEVIRRSIQQLTGLTMEPTTNSISTVSGTK